MQDVEVTNACLCANCVSVVYSFHSFKRKFFRIEEDLRLHKRQHPEAKTIHLNEVLTPNKTKSTVNKTAKKYFNVKSVNNFVCKICNLVFHAAYNLDKHNFRAHVNANQKPFQCKVCSMEFPETDILTDHMRVHNKEQYKLKCTLCNYGTNVTNSLDKHLSKTHGRKINCNICNLTFYSKKTLNRHIQRNHNINQFSECSRTLDSNNVHETHPASHKRQNIKRYMCEICNVLFQTRSGLATHNKFKHCIPLN